MSPATGHFTRNEADRLHCALLIMAAAGCGCRARCPLSSAGVSRGHTALAGGCALDSSAGGRFHPSSGWPVGLDGWTDRAAGSQGDRLADRAYLPVEIA